MAAQTGPNAYNHAELRPVQNAAAGTMPSAERESRDQPEWLPPRDLVLLGLYTRMTEQSTWRESGIMLSYIVDSSDDVLAEAKVTDEGLLFHKGTLIPCNNPKLLKDPDIVKALCLAACNDMQVAEVHDGALPRTAHELGAAGKRGRADVDWMEHERPKSKGKYHGKLPETFTGMGEQSQVAANLVMWLFEISDYLQLSGVSNKDKAATATTFLSETARKDYMARRANAAKDKDFQHTFEFFEATLRELYVPRAQKAHVSREFFSYFWVPVFDTDWTLEKHKTAFLGYEAKLYSETDLCTLLDEVRCSIFLATLPEMVWHEIKLNEQNSSHKKWDELLELMVSRENVVMNKYSSWLAQQSAPKETGKVREEDSESTPPPQSPDVSADSEGFDSETPHATETHSDTSHDD